MNHCEMVWTTAGTNRVCGRCMELKDTVVGRTDESGVTLPPLHPRCRCAIMYRELKDVKPNLTNPRTGGNLNSQTIPNSNERAIVFDNGNRNGYTVNFNLMNTKAYHDRFENLTKRKQVNESLYKQSVRILGHRSGTEYEDLVVLDARTGELLEENFSATGSRTFRCGLTDEQEEYLAGLGKNFVTLHNHPNNSFPSPDDIKSLFRRKFQVGSVIVCHNGVIYYLQALKPYKKIKDLIEITRRKLYEELIGHREDFIEKRVSHNIIEKLKRENVLRFKEVQ